MAHENPASDQFTIDWLSATEGLRDVNCPRCAYLLSGIREPRCPECGTEFKVGVRVERRVDTLFTIGLLVLGLGFSAPIGMGFLFWGSAILDPSIVHPRNMDFIVLSSIEILVGVGLIVMWIVLRRLLRRRTPVLRWVLIVVFLLLGVVANHFLLDRLI